MDLSFFHSYDPSVKNESNEEKTRVRNLWYGSIEFFEELSGDEPNSWHAVKTFFFNVVNNLLVMLQSSSLLRLRPNGLRFSYYKLY